MVLFFVGKQLGAQIGGCEFDLPRPHKEKQGSGLSDWNARAGEMAMGGSWDLIGNRPCLLASS